MNLKNNEAIGIPTLDKIIDRNPVTVKADTSVIEAINIMSRVRGKSVPLENKRDASIEERKKSSYVLVMRGVKIIGIFTERDLVKLIASGTDLTDKIIFEVMSPNVITLKQYHDRDISVAVAIMRDRNIRHLPVVGSWGQLIGIITQENIRSALTPGCLLKMRSVSDVMKQECVTASSGVSLLDIAKQMGDLSVSCTVIVEQRKTARGDRLLTIPVGIVTERDLVQFQVLELNFATTRVETVMSQPLFPVNPDSSLWQTHQFMRSQKVRRLVVVEKSGELAGIVTQSSILQVFDPLEMSRAITVLQHQVEKRTQELEQTNQQLNRTREKLELQEQESLLQLEQQQCFEAIAASIAKDFDRIISPILEASRILSSKFPDADPETQHLLQQMITNSERGIDLVEQIFSFARKLDRGFIPVQIDRVLSEVVLAAIATFPKSIDIFLDLPENETIPRILGNPTQIHEMLMNLCDNSRNAMTDGGILRICLDKESIDENLNNFDNSARVELQPYLVITVWDNGIGMSRAVKKQIFDIFANPKKTDPAQRKGIFAVINTVKNHGGFINIESDVGKGALFKVYLPALEAKPIQFPFCQLN